MALSAGSIEIKLFAELARIQSDMKKANKVVEDAMGGIQKTVRATTTVFNRLAGAFSASQIIKLADDYKRFDAQLKLSTKSVREYGEAYNNVIRIGRTAQSDIGAIGVLYARLNNNLRDFNVTQRQVADVTETISLALRTNNATVQETNSVMLQLSQSFGSGKLNGQEFLAVAEGAPMLLRQLANSLKLPFGALKDLSAQGKITREDLLKAWSDPAYIAALRQQVKEVGTVTSAITVLMNNLKQYIGEADKSTSATKTLSAGITLIADNINLLVSGAIAYGLVAFTKWTQSQYEALRATQANNAQKVIAAKVELSLAQALYASGGAVSKQTKDMANNAAATTLATSNTARLIAAQRGLAAATSTTAAAARGFSVILSTFGGWVGLAVTGVILFADKLLALYDRVRGLTPELKALNDEMERRNRLEKAGIDSSSKSAEQEEALIGQVKLYNEINAQITRQRALVESRKGFGLSVDKETKALAEMEARLRAQSSLMGTNLSQANALTPAVNENAEAFTKLSEKLTTAKERAAEYSRNQALIIIEGSKLGLSQSEIAAKLEILKDQYNKSTGATKENKKVTKELNDALREQQEFLLAMDEAKRSVLTTSIENNKSIQDEIKAVEDNTLEMQLSVEAYNELKFAKLKDAIVTSELALANAKLNGASAEAISYAEAYIQTLDEQLDLELQLAEVKRLNAGEKERQKALETHRTSVLEASKDVNAAIKSEDDAFKQLKNSVDGYAKDMASSMADWMLGTKGNFTDMINGMLKDLLRLQLQKSLFEPLTNALSGGEGGGFLGTIASALFSGATSSYGSEFSSTGAYTGGYYADGVAVDGFRAGGGKVTAGKNYIVGEQGMEMFTPKTSGSIVPNGDLGGSNVSVVINNNSKAEATAKETTDARGNRRIEVTIGDMVASEIRRSGSDAFQAIRGTFATRPRLVGR